MARLLRQDDPLENEMESGGWSGNLRSRDRRRKEQIFAGPGGAMPWLQKEGESGLKSTLEFDD